MQGKELLAAVREPLRRESCLDPASFGSLIDAVMETLASEDQGIRPPSISGMPGGIVQIHAPRVIILPDIHGRIAFLNALLEADAAPLGFPRGSVADLAAGGTVCIICLGDILHTEGPEAAERWMLAELYRNREDPVGGILSPPMNEEMQLSLAALEAVMRLKILIPDKFHCLKGNHDNTGNNDDHGDSPFFKYAHEGEMTAEWLYIRYGERIMQRLRDYELLLPLVAVGRAFCASHAEPAIALDREDILEYRSHRRVVESLIWTGNGEAQEKAAARTMANLLGREPGDDGGARWFSGHRPIAGAWAARAGGLVIQIHNPGEMQFAWIDNSKATLPAVSIFQLKDDGGGSPALNAAGLTMKG
ncbi:MAG: metallophosphoesterase [Spirochaetaceae bacterium]|nr:metallophosphoesterase [Spirochaetaceae bacterium]